MTHHFDNEMVGHAPSLHGIAKAICDQSEGMNEGFNDLGWKVLRKLLDNSEGKRVLSGLQTQGVYLAFNSTKEELPAKWN